MKVRAEQLRNHLKQGIGPIYFIFGDEPLQLRDYTDMVRKAAKYHGYDEREVYTADNQFDWDELQFAGQEMSLFASRKLIDLYLPSAKIGDKGAKAVLAYCETIPEDTVLLIHTGKVESATTRSKWFKALEQQGVVVQLWPLNEQQLKPWLVQRLAKEGLRLEDDALSFLSEQVEGNMLSADQEIIKLALLHIDKSTDSPVSLSLSQVEASVSDSSIYNTFDLFDTALKADIPKLLKMLHAFAGEGQAPAFLLFLISKELRMMASLQSLAKTLGLSQAMGKTYIFAKRKSLISQVISQHEHLNWELFLLQAAELDLMIKGIKPGDSWQALERLLSDIALAIKTG